MDRFTEGYIYAIFKETQNGLLFSCDNAEMKALVKEYLSRKFRLPEHEFKREREKCFTFYKKELNERIGQYIKNLINKQ